MLKFQNILLPKHGLDPCLKPQTPTSGIRGRLRIIQVIRDRKMTVESSKVMKSDIIMKIFDNVHKIYYVIINSD